MISMRTARTGYRRPAGLLVMTVLTALVLAGTAGATPDGADTSGAPWIASDKPDYAPGEHVTLEGSNWQPGESVRIVVDDDEGKTWKRAVTVSAGADGRISDQFDLPEWFVATYQVTATGDSGAVAKSSFTDGNVRAKSAPTSLAGQEVRFTLTYTIHKGATSSTSNTDCTPSQFDDAPATQANVGNANNNDYNAGISANHSVRLEAAATATQPAGAVFLRWTGPGGGFTPTSNPRVICITGDFTGMRTFFAEYGLNSAPVATPQSVATDEDTAKTITLAGTDADGNALTFTITTLPGNGKLYAGASTSGTEITAAMLPYSLSGTQVTYDPSANFNGSSSFTFRANDGFADSANAAVSITVSPVNDAPAGAGDPAAITMDEDGAAASVEVSGADVETAAANLVFVITRAPANGTLARGATTLAANDTFTGSPKTLSYTPDANFNGSDDFAFKVRDTGDPAGCSGAAPPCSPVAESEIVTVPIIVIAINDAPTCSNGSATTSEDTPTDLALACADVDGDPLTYTIVDGPEHGDLSGSGANRTYTPDADYHGSDSFTFKANDGTVDSNVADFELTITPVNDAPVASPQSVTTDEDTAKTITLAGTDVDGDELSFEVTTLPAHGRLFAGPSASGDAIAAGDLPYELAGDEATYDPDADYHGPDGFDFKASDGELDSAAATVSITVTPVNDGPVANDDAVGGTEDEAFEIDPAALLANDTDVDGDSLSVSSVGNAVGGTVAFEDGVITFTPDENLCGEDVAGFDYSIADGNGGTANASVTISLECVNDGPTVSADEGSVTVDEGETAENIGSFADVDGDEVALSASVGAVTKNADGTWSWSYATTDGPDESQTVTISADDGEGGTAQAAFDLTVDNVAPSAIFDAPAEVDEGDAIDLSLTTPSDPSSVDSAAGFEYAFDCGDGSGYGPYGSSDSASCPTTDDGSRTVRGKIRDKDGGESAYQTDVEIANVAPSVVAAAGQSSDEGEAKAFELGSFSDPGADSPWKVSVDWGDGSAPQNLADATAPGSLAPATHAYADDGAYTVTVTVTDKDGDAGTATFTVTVANVAPTVTLDPANTYSFDESTTAERTFGFSVSDPGDDEIELAASCGDGQLVAASLDDSSFKCIFDDDAGTEISVTATDDDGGEGSASHAVTIANVAPHVSLSGATDLDEGDVETYSFTVTDPGADTWEPVDGYPRCGANGALVEGTLLTNASGGSFDCRFPDGPKSTLVAIKVADDDGAVSADVEEVNILEVEIANVAPAVTAPADQSSDEGETKAFALGSFADPGSDGPWEVVVDWGDGSAIEQPANATAVGSLGTAGHAYADDGEYTVTVTVLDKDEESGSAEFTVTVANVAPAVTAPANQSSDEGESKAFTLGSFTDPGADGDWSVSVDWGDGSAATEFTAASPGPLGTRSHTYADSGPYTVTVTVTEAGAGEQPSGQATFGVSVANVAPRVDLTGPDEANEGDTKLYSFTVADAGVHDTWDFVDTYPRCGEHGTLVAGALQVTAAGGSFRCHFPDGGPESDPTITRVAVKVVDSDGAESLAAVDRVDIIDVNISNVAPAVTAAADQAAQEGENALFALGSFDDPGPDAPWTVDVYWGDGSPKTTFSETEPGAITAKPHAYGDNGSYTVTVKVTDRNGGRGTTTFAITIGNVAPTASAPAFAFDPLTGQATASFMFADAGWLDTHAGSYFRWSIDPEGVFRSATLSQVEQNPPDATGKASDMRALPGGCHMLTVTGVAKDDDGAESGPLTIVSGAQASVHAKGFRPPIMDSERNIAKYGNVVPVKVRLANACTGESLTSVELHITLHQGTGDETIESTNLVAESVSGADTGTKMRTADGMYIYNLSTKTLTAGKDYTLRIRPGSTAGPWILQAVLQPKK